MKQGKLGITDLVCLDCGNICSIIRKKARFKAVSHIKDLWCYKCKKVTKHYEVVDVSLFMWRDSLDEMELKVKELINNGRNKSGTNSVLKKIRKK